MEFLTLKSVTEYVYISIIYFYFNAIVFISFYVLHMYLSHLKLMCMCCCFSECLYGPTIIFLIKIQ